MSDQRALVKNAADEDQVKEAGLRLKSRRMTELNDIRRVLSIPEGRRVLWRLICHCSIYELPSAQQPYTERDIGRQGVGRFILNEICDADLEAWFEMQRESKREERNRNG